MKPLLYVLLLVAFAVFAADSPKGSTEVGRYQLASGTYSGIPSPEHVVLKIDTVTGATWQLLAIPVKADQKKYPGLNVVGWVEVVEDPIAEADKVGKKLGGGR